MKYSNSVKYFNLGKFTVHHYKYIIISTPQPNQSTPSSFTNTKAFLTLKTPGV